MQSRQLTNRILPFKLRLLATITGCVAGTAMLAWTWVALAAVPLIAAAAVQAYAPRTAKLVLWITTLFVFYCTVPLGIVGWVADIRHPSSIPFDFIGVSLTLAWMLAPILVIWLLTALIFDAIAERRRRRRAMS